MSSQNGSPARPDKPPRPSDFLLLIGFVAPIFLSASLLFVVQPLFAKVVLPRLGGSPAVWSVAMVFFQSVLFAGYAYAHLLTRIAAGRPSVIIHLVLMGVATVALPLGVAEGWGEPPQRAQALWLLGLFTTSIGLPFFALSANGPLLQAWFARTGHPDARDPYFLYAASNVGSFLALLSYPFAIEPLTRLGQQTQVWSVGFFVLIALIGGAGALLWFSPNALPAAGEGEEPAPPRWRDCAIWVALAAVPSGLLIAITAHISTDVAASPFLWVMPLALYLATFVLVFQKRPVIPHKVVELLQPTAVMILVAFFAFDWSRYTFSAIAANVGAFFVMAMLCHGELAARRPPPRYLTAFYMWMSLGGVIGGIMAGLVALQVFSWVAEYPLLIIAAILCLPTLALRRGPLDLAFWVMAAAGLIYLFWPYFTAGNTDLATMTFQISIVAMLAIALLVQRDALKFAATIAGIFAFALVFGADAGNYTFIRSFFGVYKIVDSDGGMYRTLKHGTTEHGAQYIRTASGDRVTGRPEPLTYYFKESPLGQAAIATREKKNGPVHTAVVGLGTGTMACYDRPGDKLDYYEIDVSVVRIAKEYFSYLAECAPHANLILGDARLTLAKAEDGKYDMIVLDAFTSDAIPVHLVTKEAMAIYAKKLAPDGVIFVHVSNRHMDLGPVVAGIAAANGLVARESDSSDGTDDSLHKYSSTVVAVARKDEDFGPLLESGDWIEKKADEAQWVWTDDYSNVLGAMLNR